MRIAIVDDDAALLEKLAAAFEDSGYEVLTALDGGRGFKLGRRPDVSAVVSDADVPGMSGLTLCRRLRAEGRSVPFVLLTSSPAAVDGARRLEVGVDDCFTKPVSARVLVARVAELLRRERLPPVERPGDVVRAGALELHRGRLEARYHGAPLSVTTSEFWILDALASQPGRVLSREQLLEHARESDTEVGLRIADTYIGRLRRKLKAIDESGSVIETVIGEGYKLRSDN